ncbi:MAG TPA: type IV secretory system conjugative DNA transfer family protein [Spongiibacteraceae bacterium]|jgi:type IV secretion system protein VirD4
MVSIGEWLLGNLILWALVAARIFLKKRNEPQQVPFKDYATNYLKQRWMWLLPSALLALFGAGVAAVIVLGISYLIYALVHGKLIKNNKKDVAEWVHREDIEQRAWNMELGSTPQEAITRINEIFDSKSRTLHFTRCVEWQDQNAEGLKTKAFAAFTISRNLAAMDVREREFLRVIELMQATLSDSEQRLGWYRWAKFGLLWGDGKATIDGYSWFMFDKEKGVRDGPSMLKWFASDSGASVDSVINSVLKAVEDGNQVEVTDPIIKSMLQDINGRLSGGNAWLTADEVSKSIFARKSKIETTGAKKLDPWELSLGMLDDGLTVLSYSGEGSLITVAPPGSGKTQCNVLPNLLGLKAPALVLDVKGEIYRDTSKWRSENVGPVYKFSPLDPANSDCYNPLTFIRAEADNIWEDSRFLADMMIVPSKSSDPFWENKARDVVTAAIAYLCYYNPPEQRPMARIVDIVHGGKPWDEMVIGLQGAADVRSMVQQGTSLAAMNEKTRDSVLQTGQASLSAWSGERIARVTQKSDWSPLDLRNAPGTPATTIYICVKPSEIESYVSVLRVFIAQHIRMLTDELPSSDIQPILFVLDELPQLRHMPPVEDAVSIGRQYGLRLWMFVQSLGQLENAYPNAMGMVGSCALRIFMNPSSHDGTAEKLSEELGYRQSSLDGSRQKIVEATELAGPNFRDYMVVLAASSKPVKVKKAFAYENSVLKARVGSL